MLRYQKGYIYEGHTFVVKKSDIRNAPDSAFVDATALIPMPDVTTTADHIRTMTDKELAGYMAKMLADYTTGLYDGAYTPSAEVISEVTGELLRQLQQPHESPTGQKG